jgi:2-keto-3-deoxy-6-phosphogluconate aldolase
VTPDGLIATEVMKSRKAGADLVKMFPCAQVGAPDYVRALKAPFPKVRWWLRAGRTGRWLKRLLPRMIELANRFSGIVAKARAGMPE